MAATATLRKRTISMSLAAKYTPIQFDALIIKVFLNNSD